ncbi:hypothetical protein VIN01S_26210 [Vibrio inusitatus NBRC 102082]|uniref:Uncharacterized protein n=1 Tax=Vibrio inusitatus NBRC 102082 TaxID=1219070 RepID=A0A4Y3HXK3_9VIBR|nr:hypothetical protein VIN01S_26210 [Vibrio inusitatus NBRC 102082]
MCFLFSDILKVCMQIREWSPGLDIKWVSDRDQVTIRLFFPKEIAITTTEVVIAHNNKE